MRKVTAIFLIILYLIPAVGFSVGLHLCGNGVAEIFSIESSAKGCVCTKKISTKCCKSSTRCCKEIHIEVKLDASQEVASTLTISKNTGETKTLIGTIFSSELFASSLPKNGLIRFYPLRFSYIKKHAVYLVNSSLLL